MINEIRNEIEKSVAVKQAVLQDENIHAQLESLANTCLEALRAGGKVIFCGNGGSFGDSQHLAAELVSRLRFDRAPLASIALGTNSSNLTAIGNDYGYEFVFARELQAVGKKEDVFIPISTSGNSKNVLEAIKTAKHTGMYVCGFTGGTGGNMASLCDCIIVPSAVTDKIQESHIMFGHIVCHLIESQYFKRD